MDAARRDALKEQLRQRPADAHTASYVEMVLERLSAPPPPAPDPLEGVEALAPLVDHTQLRPEATEARIHALCAEATRYGFAAVCISPCHVPLAAAALGDSPVRVCTVVGFPSGAAQTRVKAFEAAEALAVGADEIDMVLPIGMLRSGRLGYVEDDIRAVVEAASGAALVKVILETALLRDDEKALACVLARRAGADFVKTSTGFSTGGATPEDVALMRQLVGAEMGVKAAGGVRSFKDAQRMVAAGATRIGASGAVAIMEGAAGGDAY